MNTADTPTLEGCLVSVQVGKTRRYVSDDGREWASAIVKESVAGRVAVGPENVAGDTQTNRKNHGGPEKAVCAYAIEHYPVWRETLDLPDLPHGAFGENLSVSNLTEAQVCVGDVLKVGSAVLQVSQPRIPCQKVDNRWNRPGFQSRMTERNATGYYLRVLQTGEIGAGDTLTLQERPHPGWSIVRVNRVLYDKKTPPEEIAALLDLSAFSDEMKRGLASRR